MKTHNLISGIKSEDTYGYVPDYTKPLICIGCHIGFIFIRSDRVWLNILLDKKNGRYRHWNRLPMLLGSKTTGYLILYRYLEIDKMWKPIISSLAYNLRILMDMFLFIPNLSQALAVTLDLYLLGVIVYDWTSFLTRKTVGIDTEIVFLCCSVPRLLDTLYLGDYTNSF